MKRNADDDVIVLNLRDWHDSRAGARLLDSWTAHASPLEHWFLATADCRAAERAAGRRECEAETWTAHLAVCSNCAAEVARVEVVAFAAELAAWREAVA